MIGSNGGMDDQAFADFLVEQRNGMIGYALRAGFDFDTAEDLYQDVSMSMVKAHNRGRTDFIQDPEKYMCRAMRNQQYDELKKWYNRVRLGQFDQDDDECESRGGGSGFGYRVAVYDEPGQSIQDDDVTQKVRDYLNPLSQVHADVFLLRTLEELSYAEIAERLGIPLWAVRNRLFNARRRLKEISETADIV